MSGSSLDLTIMLSQSTKHHSAVVKFGRSLFEALTLMFFFAPRKSLYGDISHVSHCSFGVGEAYVEHQTHRCLGRWIHWHRCYFIASNLNSLGRSPKNYKFHICEVRHRRRYDLWHRRHWTCDRSLLNVVSMNWSHPCDDFDLLHPNCWSYSR